MRSKDGGRGSGAKLSKRNGPCVVTAVEGRERGPRTAARKEEVPGESQATPG